MRFFCDAILFDLDGVLVDSAACILRQWRRWARRHGLDAEALVEQIHGRRTVEIVRQFAPHLPAEDEAAAIAAEEAADTDGIVPIDGAVALLRRLPPARWAVATSGSRLIATTRLRHTGLPVPAVLVTADDVARGKPDPAPYMLAALRLGVAPARCLVVEDAPPGIEAGRAAGMKTLGLATTAPPDALARADAVIHRLGDLTIHQNGTVPLVVEVAS